MIDFKNRKLLPDSSLAAIALSFIAFFSGSANAQEPTDKTKVNNEEPKVKRMKKNDAPPSVAPSINRAPDCGGLDKAILPKRKTLKRFDNENAPRKGSLR